MEPFEILKRAAEGYRWSHYDKTIKLKDKYVKYITGERLDEELKRFELRVTKEQFRILKEITHPITPAICETAMTVFDKGIDSSAVFKAYSFGADDSGKRKDLAFTKMVDNYFGDDSLDDYLSTIIKAAMFTDPNAYLITEWEDAERNELTNQLGYIKPYPFLSGSEMVIDRKYKNNTLQYLIVNYISESGRQVFTYYGKDATIVLKQIDKDEPIDSEYTIVEVGVDKYIKIEAQPHNLGYVPAKRISNNYSLIYGIEVCVSPLEAGWDYLEKTIKANSELDVTMAYHAHPQKIVAVDECKNEYCMGGKLADGSTCKTCGGSGKSVSTTSLDTIEVSKEELKEGGLTLDGLVKYLSPNTDIVKLQIDFIEQLKSNFLKSIFHSDSYLNSSISDTATGKIIDQRSLYKTLYKFVKNWVKLWKFEVETIANVADMTDITIQWNVDKDFMLETLNDVLAQLKAAKDAGASTNVIEAIEHKAFELSNTNNRGLVTRRIAMEKFKPFKEKSSQEVMSILGFLPVDNYYRVLHMFYSIIWDELEREYGSDVYSFDDATIKGLLDAKVKERINEIKGVVPRADFNALGEAIDTEQTTDIEAESKAKLKGTVGGVEGVIAINAAVSAGTMSEEAAQALLVEIYGFSKETAVVLTKKPDVQEAQKIAKINDQVDAGGTI